MLQCSKSLSESACFFENICHVRSANVLTLTGTLFLQYKSKTNFSNIVRSASLGIQHLQCGKMYLKHHWLNIKMPPPNMIFCCNQEICPFRHVLKMRESQEVF